MLRKSVFIVFFVSGFTGLVYEVVWLRLFGLIFGNTTLAMSTVLSAYMLGLALGSKILGSIADRITNHLKVYAFLELGIGVFAVLIFLLQPLAGQIFSHTRPASRNRSEPAATKPRAAKNRPTRSPSGSRPSA